MIIKKVLNNNAAICFDEQSDELIVLDKGISFQKKSGDLVTLSPQAKVFKGSNHDLNNKLLTVVATIPQTYIDLTETIVELLEKTYQKRVNKSIYVTLTEHIHGAIERHESGIEVSNPFLTEIQRMYSDEYAVGKQALLLIEKQFGMIFKDDEAGFIAFHLVNAELNGDMKNIVQITKFMQDVLDVVKYHFKVEFNEDSLHYHRFVTHLKFFAQRIILAQTYKQENLDMFELFKQKYEKSYQCVQKISLLVNKQYLYQLNEEEQLYLMIHIEKVINQAIK